MQRRRPLRLRRLTLPLLASSLAACSSDHALVMVPFQADDRAALIAVQSADTLELFAVDDALRASSPILKSIADQKNTVRTTALFYRETLSALGLEPGAIALPAAGSPARAIPTAARIEQLELATDGDPGAWSTLDALPAELAGVQLPGVEGCVPMVWRDVPLPGESEIYGGAPTAEGAAIIVASEALDAEVHLYRVDANGAARLPRGQLPADFRALTAGGNLQALYISGTLNAEPAIYFRNAQDSYGLLDQRPVETAGHVVRALMTPPIGSEDGALLYTVNARGDVDRYQSEPLSPAHWEVQMVNPQDRTGELGSAIWNAAGDLYFVAPDGKDILRYASRLYTREVVEIEERLNNGEDRVLNLIQVPGLGSFGGTDRGDILRKGINGWGLLRPGTATASVTAFALWRGGFLAGTAKGALVHYDPRDQFCEDEIVYVGATSSIRSIIAFDDLIIVAGVDRLTGAAFIRLVTPITGS